MYRSWSALLVAATVWMAAASADAEPIRWDFGGLITNPGGNTDFMVGDPVDGFIIYESDGSMTDASFIAGGLERGLGPLGGSVVQSPTTLLIQASLSGGGGGQFNFTLQSDDALFSGIPSAPPSLLDLTSAEGNFDDRGGLTSFDLNVLALAPEPWSAGLLMLALSAAWIRRRV